VATLVKPAPMNARRLPLEQLFRRFAHLK